MKSLLACFISWWLAAAASAYTVSGNIYKTNGSQSDVASAARAAPDGAVITLPDGSYTWSTSSPVKIKTAVTLQAENMPAWPNASRVTITNSGGSGVYPLEITPSGSGNTTIAGLNWLNTDSTDTQSYFLINGTAKPVLMHDCTFTVGNFKLLHTIAWFAGNGVIWHCTFNMTGLGNGVSTSGGIYNDNGNLGWWVPSTFGNKDAAGDKKVYVEDCVFNNFWNQGLDVGDNGRMVIRYNTFNNTQCLTHGVTGYGGGREVEFYNNNCVYYPVNSNGDKLPDSGSQSVSGGFWPAMQRWFWWRAGTGYVHHNNIQVIYSYGYWGSPPACWAFTNESLTRTGGQQTTCQKNSDYIGFHWCGSGGNGNTSNTSDYRTYRMCDPVYIWANTYNRGYADNDSQIAKIDQQDCPPVRGVNKTSDVFLKDRDYYIGSIAAPDYKPYTYPHPLRTSGADRRPRPRRLPRHSSI
jgi:hypothetical protein